MSDEQLMLKWSDFHNNVEKAFEESRKGQDFFDITLVCEDYEVQAHRLVLSSGSNFFQGVLRKYSHPQPLIYLKGILKCELEAVLEFLYTGKVSIQKNSLEAFLNVAKDLKIKGIGDQDEPSTKNTEDIQTIKEEPSESTKSTTKHEMILEEQYSCDECQYFTTNKTSLKRHTLQHFSKINEHEAQMFVNSYHSSKKYSLEIAKCKLCGKVKKITDHSTTPMRKHLYSLHKEQYEIMSAEERPNKLGSSGHGVKESKVWNYFEKVDDKAAILDSLTTKGIKKRHTKPNQSLVWQFFEKDPPLPPKCKVCQNTVPSPGGSTSGLWKHMTKKHGHVGYNP